MGKPTVGSNPTPSAIHWFRVGGENASVNLISDALPFQWPVDVNDCIRFRRSNASFLRSPVRREWAPLARRQMDVDSRSAFAILSAASARNVARLREADALYRRLAFRRFEQTLFAQPRVFPTKRKQLLVGSALDDTAVIKHENLICAHDSGKPVRDYDGSAVEHQSLQRFLDESLRRRVHARRRFIQNQNWRILQQRSRNRKPLLFAHTQLYSALPHHAAQSVRQPIDEGTRVCHRRCLQQFFIRRIRLPDLQVLADGAVKQKAFLRHHPDLLPQRANAEITNRTSID